MVSTFLKGLKKRKSKKQVSSTLIYGSWSMKKKVTYLVLYRKSLPVPNIRYHTHTHTHNLKFYRIWKNSENIRHINCHKVLVADGAHILQHMAPHQKLHNSVSADETNYDHQNCWWHSYTCHQNKKSVSKNKP